MNKKEVNYYKEKTCIEIDDCICPIAKEVIFDLLKQTIEYLSDARDISCNEDVVKEIQNFVDNHKY